MSLVFVTILRSVDGSTWTVDANGYDDSGANTVYGVTSASGGTSIIRNNGTSPYLGLARSTDGINWTQHASPLDTYQAAGQVSHIATNGSGTWVATGQVAGTGHPIIVTSTDDGLTWTTTLSPSATDEIMSALWTGSTFVCGGLKPGIPATIWTSATGSSWTQQTLPAPFLGGVLGGPANDLATDGTQVIAVGQFGDGTNNNVMVSTNSGVTWATVANPFSAASYNLFGIAYSGSIWTVVGTHSGNVVVMTSPDGVTWTARTPPSPWGTTGGQGNSVTWASGLGLFIMVVSNTADGRWVATSPTGVTWTSRTTPIDGVGFNFMNEVSWDSSHAACIAVGLGFYSRVVGMYTGTGAMVGNGGMA